MTELRTERLTLRPLQASDHAALLAHWADPRVCRFLFDGTAPTAPRVTEFIVAGARDFATSGYGLWAVRITGSHGLIGMAGLRPLEAQGEIEIIYSLGPRYWGQGIATEAAGAVLRHAFETAEMARVLAEIDESNATSAAVAGRLGMRAVKTVPGELGPMVHYVVTRGEWFESRRAGGG